MGKADTLMQEVGETLTDDWGKRSGSVADRLARSKKTTHSEATMFDGRKRDKDAAFIDVSRIVADGQVRTEFNEEKLEELAHSLKTVGQQQPICVYWHEEREQYVIISGERRWRAAQRAKLEQLRCVVHPHKPTDDERVELQLVENAIREDLNPIEEARSYHDLKELKKCTGQQLAERLGKNQSTISRALSLLKLPQDVQEQISAGKLPVAVAREIVKLKTEAEQREMLADYHAGGLTSSDTAKVVSAKKNGGKKTGQGGQKTKRNFTTANGCKVTLTRNKRATRQEILEAIEEAAQIVRAEIEADGRSQKSAA